MTFEEWIQKNDISTWRDSQLKHADSQADADAINRAQDAVANLRKGWESALALAIRIALDEERDYENSTGEVVSKLRIARGDAP